MYFINLAVARICILFVRLFFCSFVCLFACLRDSSDVCLIGCLFVCLLRVHLLFRTVACAILCVSPLVRIRRALCSGTDFDWTS